MTNIAIRSVCFVATPLYGYAMSTPNDAFLQWNRPLAIVDHGKLLDQCTQALHPMNVEY